jgi:hypothetical protein
LEPREARDAGSFCKISRRDSGRIREHGAARPRGLADAPFGRLAEPKLTGDPPSPLCGCGAAAFACQKLAGLPSRSSFVHRTGPSSRLRRSGAASFACIHERRMVDQNSASWNRVVQWMRQLQTLSQVS